MSSIRVLYRIYEALGLRVVGFGEFNLGLKGFEVYWSQKVMGLSIRGSRVKARQAVVVRGLVGWASGLVVARSSARVLCLPVSERSDLLTHALRAGYWMSTGCARCGEPKLPQRGRWGC